MRYPFGCVGSQLFGTIIAGISCGIGWFAVQAWLFGIIVNTLFPTAWWANVGVAAIWGGLLMMITAIIGFKGLAWLSYLAVPFFMLLAGVGVMISIAGAGAGGFTGIASIQPASPVSFGIGVTEVVGMYIAGGVITADISRYSKKVLHGPMAWIVQVMIFQVYMLTGAGVLTLATGAANIAEALVIGGAGIGAFLMAIFGQWTTNDNNLYNGALSFATWMPFKKKYITIAEGLIGVALAAWFGFTAAASMEPFQNFLVLLGKILPAIGGALIADFYLYRWYKREPVNERYKPRPGMKIAQVNWIGWASVVLATLLGGWVIKSGIPTLTVLILGALFYIIIMLICDKAGVKVALGEHVIDETGV
jgi:cytosine permease